MKRGRHKGIPHKKGLDYFEKKKFGDDIIIDGIKDIFANKPYKRILVGWVKLQSPPKNMYACKFVYGNFNIQVGYIH